MASRHGAFDDCFALDGNHVWDDGAPRQGGEQEVIGEWLGGTIMGLNALIPDSSAFRFGARPNTTVKQGLLIDLAHKKWREEMVGAAGI